MTLTLEIKGQSDKTGTYGTSAGGVMLLTPPIDESYWQYRVMLGERQAIVGFPKFTTIGIGFAVEDDWNTNLPYTQDAAAIFDHIKHNKGDDGISDDDCLAAIRMIQDAVRADRPTAT